MLLKFDSIRQTDISKLLAVYAEAINRDYSNPQAYSNGESAFIDDLYTFFACPNTELVVWAEDGRYLAALRLEGYEDGSLISCLETMPQARRQGYATKLLKAVFCETPGPIYAHVEKNNRPSLAFHKTLGFCMVKDYAVYVDGSVYHRSCTMKRD